MGLAPDDLAEFGARDPSDDEDVPLGDALEELAIHVDTTPSNQYATFEDAAETRYAS